MLIYRHGTEVHISQQKLRDMCRHPQNVQWTTFLKCRNEKAIKDHATAWPFENKAVVSVFYQFLCSHGVLNFSTDK